MSLFNQAFRYEQFLAAKETLLVSLGKGLLNPFFVGVCDIDGNAYRYLSCFDGRQKTLFTLF
jgi:hypothetical protein